MKKSSKKIFALLLSAIMLVTSIPFAAFTAFAADGDAKDKYLFAYFTGDQPDKQKVRFALSDDGYNYKAINNGAAVITQNLGTKCARDPYLFEGQNGEYYVICTNMDASLGWWGGSGSSMVIWKSTDLINWTNETIIDMPAMIGEDKSTVNCCWAPQVIWDSTANKYMIYFTLCANYTGGKQVLYYCHATDLLDQSTWTKPQLLYAPTSGNPAIDGDIFYNSKDNTYYLYYKDEDNATICYVTSANLTGPYSTTPTKVLNVDVALEGANCFIPYGSDKIVMVADAYTSGYFVVAESTDYKNFTILDKSQYSVNHLSPRHGSIINITSAQYDALVNAYGIVDTTEVSYDFTDGYNVAPTGWFYETHTDSTGWVYDVMSHGGSVAASNGKCKIVTSNLFINEGAAREMVMSDSWTISFSHTLDDASKAATTMLAIGNIEQDFVRLACDGTFTVNGTAAANKANVVTGVESSYIITYDGQAVSLYQDGTLVASVQTTLNVSYAANGSLYIGVGNSDTNSAGYTTSTYGSLRMSPKAINSEYNLGELTDLMNEFERMLSKGTVYKNMGNAYAAYVQAQKAYDAYYYGDDTNVDLTAAATALRVAMLSMVKWTQPVASNPRPTFAAGTVPDGTFQNLLYTNRINSYEALSVTHSYSKTEYEHQVGYSETVMMYDGITEPQMPVITTSRRKKVGTGTANRAAWSAFPTNGTNSTTDNGDLYLPDMWYSSGGDGWNFGNIWGKTNYRLGNNSSTFNKGREANPTAGMWSGYISYANVMNFNNKTVWGSTEYLKTYKNLNWCFCDEGPSPSSISLSAMQKAFGAVNDNSTIYVINYKAVLDKINEVKTLSANIANYSEGGLSQLFAAYDQAVNFDPNTYFTSSNGYQACADEISRLVGLFPSSSTVDSQAYENLRQAITNYRNVTPPACINADVQKAYTNALAAAQNAMKAVYSVDKTATYSTDSNAIQTLADSLNEKAEAYKNSTHAYKWNRDEADKAIFVCTNCGDEYTVDIQNYNTVAMIYDTLDSAKYTPDAWTVITDQKAEFDRIKNDRHIDPYTQEVVDRVVRLLLSAINNPLGGDKDLEKQTFKVTHRVVTDNDETNVPSVTGTYYYGQLAQPVYDGTGTVTSWEVKVGSSSAKVVATDAREYPLLVQDDTVITTYVRSNNTETYVNIVDQYGKVLYSIPASEGDTILCDGNNVKVGENESVTVPNMPYMNVTGFRINGTVSNSGTVKAGENKINPIYTPADGSYTITADGAVVTVNGEESATAKYDNTVTVTFPEETYAIAIQNSDGSYAVAAYGNEYTFFANRNMTFYAVNGANSNYTIGGAAVTDSLTIHRLDYKLPFAYAEVALTDAATNKYTTFCAYSTEVPAGVTVLEKGTIYTKNTALTNDTFVIGGDGVLQNVNTNTAGSGNQYSLSIRNSAGVKSRAYVKYTYTYEGREITAISYGNICTAE